MNPWRYPVRFKTNSKLSVINRHQHPDPAFVYNRLNPWCTLNLDAEAEEVQGASSSTEPQPGSSKSGVKRKLRSGKVSSKRPKEECQPIDPPPRYDLYSKEVSIYYPTVAKASEHHIGVADSLISKRSKFGKRQDVWRYRCLFSSQAESVGFRLREEDENCEFWTQQSSATVTHVRRFHLGIALGCKFCDWRTYSGASWKPHMLKFHKSVPQEKWYATEEEGIMQGIKVELEEVPAEALLSAAQGE